MCLYVRGTAAPKGALSRRLRGAAPLRAERRGGRGGAADRPALSRVLALLQGTTDSQLRVPLLAPFSESCSVHAHCQPSIFTRIPHCDFAPLHSEHPVPLRAERTGLHAARFRKWTTCIAFKQVCRPVARASRCGGTQRPPALLIAVNPALAKLMYRLKSISSICGTSGRRVSLRL